jgi:hypothetical protein
MRKIEKQMLDAIRSRKNWSKDNTRVEFVQGDGGDMWWCNVYLHGHHIAEFNEMTWNATVNVDTLRQWPTVTTKSRLRALGANITQKKGVVYLDGKSVAEV